MEKQNEEKKKLPFDRESVKMWHNTLERYRKIKEETGVDIIRLIDQGSKLLEKKYSKPLRQALPPPKCGN